MFRVLLFLTFSASCAVLIQGNVLPEAFLTSENIFADCGISFETDELDGRKVLGGESTAPGRWPWMVYLYLKHEGLADGFICGGTLISSEYVLTAAHCLDYYDYPEAYGIVLGEHTASSISGLEMVVDVVDVIRHENFHRITLLNDIGLIKLAKPVEFTPHIRPICLPGQGFPTDANTKMQHDGKFVTYAGETCTVTGWGRTETKPKADVLQQLNVTILPRLLCTPITSRNLGMYRDIVRPEDSRFCAGGVSGEDTCDGDSGGPLVCKDEDTGRYHLHGLTSFGPVPCGQVLLPGIYTEVSKYRDWIEANKN